MAIEAATTFERLTSYIVETQKRYRKEIFLQRNKRHCLVVRKEAFLLLVVVLFFPLKALLCDCRMMSVVFSSRLDVHH